MIASPSNLSVADVVTLVNVETIDLTAIFLSVVGRLLMKKRQLGLLSRQMLQKQRPLSGISFF